MQQQQHADYDLLAVFPDEAQADTAASKLRKEGFGDDEVYQLPAGTVGSGQFREHGPNRARSKYFLRTQRSGPNPALIVLFAVIFGVILAALAFAASFALPTLPEPTSIITGAVIGLVVGAIIGVLWRGRVRGNIGQTLSTQNTARASSSSGLTVVALRFPDPDNISRRSRARAILINSGGKIDRSVGRRE